MSGRVAAIFVGLALIAGAGAAFWLLSADDAADLSAALGRRPAPVDEATHVEDAGPGPTRQVETDRHVTDVTPREGAIQGTVVRPDGTHVPDAEVRIRLSVPSGERNYALVSDFDETVTTNEEGHFQLDEIPGGGVYRIVARGEAFAPGVVSGVRPGDVVKIKLGSPSTLTGTVLEDGTERPLANVKVIARLPAPHEQRTVETDGAGSFRFEQLPAGHFTIDVDAPEHVVPDAIEELIVAGETRKITVRLVAGKEITGSVFARDDERPLADAVVRIGRRTGVTDGRGHFVVKGLATRLHTVRVSAWGHLPSSMNVNLSGSRREANVVFRLQRGASIIGRVLDPDGNPVPDCPIRLFVTWNERYDGRNAWEDQATAGRGIITDEWGQFEIAGIETRSWAWYVVRTAMEGVPDAWSRTVKIRGVDDRATADIRLGYGTSLVGVVTDEDENPIGGARVQVTPEGYWSSRGNQAIVTGTDEYGQFEVAGLTEGRYTVMIDARGYSRGWKGGIRIRDGIAPADLTFTLVAGQPLAGVVRDKQGEPLAGVRVDAWARGGHGHAMTDSNGVFVMESVPKGPWRMRATLEGYATWNKNDVSLESDGGEDGIEISLAEQAVVFGQIVEASTGEPVRGFRLTFSKEDTERRRRRTVYNRHVNDRDGRFRVQLPNQTCRLDVQAPGYVGHTIEAVTFEAGVEGEPLRIELRKGGSIEGYVRDEQGNPLAGVTIYRRPGLPFDGDYASAAHTETDGYFFMGDLDEGSHDLVYVAYGRPIEIWEGIRVAGDDPANANAHLSKDTTLKLVARLPRQENQPDRPRNYGGWRNRRYHRGVSVKVTSLDQTPFYMQRTTRDPVRGRLYRPSPTRTFSLRSRMTTTELPAGRYRLVATMRGMPTITRDITLISGATREVTLDFAALVEPAEESTQQR